MAEINPAPHASRRVATVFGGSGFIGRYVVKRLAAADYVVRVAVPNTEGALFLKPMGNVGQVVPLYASLTNSDTIARAVEGADLVVNLVGILAERRPGDFQRLHTDGAERVAGHAATAGVQRLTHISAIGADPNSPSLYAKTKGLGEQAVRAAFPNAAILRPSVVFGPEDQLFNRFAAMATISPIMPVIAGTTKFQPVFVGDVADAVMATLTQPGHSGMTFELGGPRIWTMHDLLAFILTEIRRKRPLVNIPLPVARLQASVLERLPGKMLTRDQLVLLQRDNVVNPNMPGLVELGITPTPVEMVVPGYLARFRPGGGSQNSYGTK